jgi:DNA-binding NarL/FixJ family response regulator
MAGLVISGDLFFAGSLAERARAAEKDLALRSLEAALATESPNEIRLLLVDLSSLNSPIAEVIAALKAKFPIAHVIAFGPHVQEAILSAAVDAGCDEVLTRGQMHQQIGRFIAQL